MERSQLPASEARAALANRGFVLPPGIAAITLGPWGVEGGWVKEGAVTGPLRPAEKAIEDVDGAPVLPFIPGAVPPPAVNRQLCLATIYF